MGQIVDGHANLEIRPGPEALHGVDFVVSKIFRRFVSSGSLG